MRTDGARHAMQVIPPMQDVCEFPDEVGELQLQTSVQRVQWMEGCRREVQKDLTFEYRLKCARTELKGTMLRQVTGLVFVRMRCIGARL
jgi:hypothetical protein